MDSEYGKFEHACDWRMCEKCRHVAAVAVERSFSLYRCGCPDGINRGKWSSMLQSPTQLIGGRPIEACPDFAGEPKRNMCGDMSKPVSEAFAKSGEMLRRMVRPRKHGGESRKFQEIVHTESGDELVYRTTTLVER